MRKVLSLVALLLCLQLAQAQTGSWQAYMAYQEPQQIVKGGNLLYVRASNSLYSYNLDDQSIVTYDKIRQLSDNYITLIAWNQTTQKLIIVYQNSNIDLLDAEENVTNISSLYTKTMTQDKTINDIFINDKYAYLATNFGIVKIDMKSEYVAETYTLNKMVTAIDIREGSIYARVSGGPVITALMSRNLINPNNWTTATSLPDDTFQKDLTDWNQYYEQVKTLQPGGPLYNYFNFMAVKNGMLYTTGGGWKDGGEFARPGCLQTMDGNQDWTCIADVKPLTGTRFRDVTAVAIDPADANHLFFSTCGTGLYEFQNGEMVKNYDATNSPIISALSDTDPNANNYVRIDGLIYDNSGCIWMSNSSSRTQYPLLKYNPSTKEWSKYNNEKLFFQTNPLRILHCSVLDYNGNIWMANDHHSHPCMICIDPKTETIKRYDNWLNQDGTSYELKYIHCIAQDLEGNIWMGSDQGLFMYDAQQQADPEQGFTQVKVPRNDGTDYADYLLASIDIACIKVDGANRKWIGTDGNGVYLVSADNMQQLQHFTVENSPLLSNIIESIAINDETGEVFFGTDKGLCSYMADATAAVNEMTKDNVYAFPNPVPSGYNGLITVRGLSFDADVKIITTSGKLVAQGRSNGGTFTWNGCDTKGRRVASGIYMIVTAKSDGTKGVVNKIAVIH